MVRWLRFIPQRPDLYPGREIDRARIATTWRTSGAPGRNVQQTLDAAFAAAPVEDFRALALAHTVAGTAVVDNHPLRQANYRIRCVRSAASP